MQRYEHTPLSYDTDRLLANRSATEPLTCVDGKEVSSSLGGLLSHEEWIERLRVEGKLKDHLNLDQVRRARQPENVVFASDSRVNNRNRPDSLGCQVKVVESEQILHPNISDELHSPRTRSNAFQAARRRIPEQIPEYPIQSVHRGDELVDSHTFMKIKTSEKEKHLPQFEQQQDELNLYKHAVSRSGQVSGNKSPKCVRIQETIVGPKTYLSKSTQTSKLIKNAQEFHAPLERTAVQGRHKEQKHDLIDFDREPVVNQYELKMEQNTSVSKNQCLERDREQLHRLCSSENACQGKQSFSISNEILGNETPAETWRPVTCSIDCEPTECKTASKAKRYLVVHDVTLWPCDNNSDVSLNKEDTAELERYISREQIDKSLQRVLFLDDRKPFIIRSSEASPRRGKISFKNPSGYKSLLVEEDAASTKKIHCKRSELDRANVCRCDDHPKTGAYTKYCRENIAEMSNVFCNWDSVSCKEREENDDTYEHPDSTSDQILIDGGNLSRKVVHKKHSHTRSEMPTNSESRSPVKQYPKRDIIYSMPRSSPRANEEILNQRKGQQINQKLTEKWKCSVCESSGHKCMQSTSDSSQHQVSPHLSEN